ncbi:InlB B-repeat-containing protein, partial [Bifidobacterium sp. W8113]
TAPTLETAGTDGQPLKLSRTGDAWQTDIPARQPGPAAITITGRQDDQPFTRSLTYTVDQTLTRDLRQGSAYTVRFDTGGGNPTPQDQSIQPVYGRVQRPSPDPTRPGYQFDGWFTGITAYDFSKPVTDNITITAHWTPNKQWSISPDKGGQFGHESTTITPPDKISGIQFNQISGGKGVMIDTQGVSLAVGSDGNAYAWGRNNCGQLGDGTTTTRYTPVMVKTPDRSTYPDLPKDFTYVQVSAGGSHSLAIGSDGYVYAWGNNDHGQLGNNTKSNSSTPVRVHGPNNSSEGLKAIQVAAGSWNSMALGADGTVYTWGSISKGYSEDCSSPQTVPTTVEDPSDASGVFHAVQISTSWSFDMALGQDGYVYTWGYNTNGQLGNNTSDTTTTNIFHPTPSRVFASSQSTAAAGPWLKAVQVSAGGWHALAIDEDRNTWAWGRNNNGQLGDGTTIDQTAPVKVGKPAGTPTDFTYLQVSAGTFHSLALGSDGNAYAWGSNNYGQLGDWTTDQRRTPVKVSKPAGAPADFTYLQFSPGFYHSVALGSDGYAYAWGFNRYGQLGDNTTNSKRTPVPVAFNPLPLITGVRFDQTPATGLTRGDGSSVTVLTPAHLPGTVTVSVDYTLGRLAQQPDTSLRYTYLPAGVLPRAGGEGILLALATGMTGMGGVLASRRHRREQHQLLHASLE